MNKKVFILLVTIISLLTFTTFSLADDNMMNNIKDAGSNMINDAKRIYWQHWR